MQSRSFLALLSIGGIAATALYAVHGVGRADEPRQGCGLDRHPVFDIKASNDPAVRRQQWKDLSRNLRIPGATVRLWPDVHLDTDLDFSAAFSDTDPVAGLPRDLFPIRFGPCVTLTSVAPFDEHAPPRAEMSGSSPTVAARAGLRPPVGDLRPELGQARTPKSRGPVLRYGKHHDAKKLTFFQAECDDQPSEDNPLGNGVRVSGFRLFGPDFGQQETDESGLRIVGCVDIEISNMEIAGWGGQGILIEDDVGTPGRTTDGGRIRRFDQVRIHDNFFHHNQQPSHLVQDGLISHFHAGGYGINVGHGAWARISRNVFDFNRHGIAAPGDTGGYIAEQNLVLKGGGYHGGIVNKYTHIFDVHGTGSNGLGGTSGIGFSYVANAFQYRKDNAIKIRGRIPTGFNTGAFIGENVFPHPGLEDDWGDDAVNLDSPDNVSFGLGTKRNVVNLDTFGSYGVCDFDGDGTDDLFLATGATWWFSSVGQFHWTHLNARKELLKEVRLGYFDDDQRCDVLTERNGQWGIHSGGKGEWTPLGPGAFEHARLGQLKLDQVQFGRFDPSQRDHRIGATRRTTHAFFRDANGQWWITPLSHKDWQKAQSSSFPMNQLRFGDFTGDGVTDVLAVVNGRWHISQSAMGSWRPLNQTLHDPVGPLFIANMDGDDNIDDILRLDRRTERFAIGVDTVERVTLTWWRSKNGTEPWKRWKDYTFQYRLLDSADVVSPGSGFAGRFVMFPGGATLVVDQNRLGWFHSESEAKAKHVPPDWSSLFPY